MQIYTDPTRSSDPNALPNAEVFHVSALPPWTEKKKEDLEPGWYWWSCFPGCLPDGEPNGPFDTETEATDDAQE